MSTPIANSASRQWSICSGILIWPDRRCSIGINVRRHPEVRALASLEGWQDRCIRPILRDARKKERAPQSVRMFCSRPENFAFDGLEGGDRKVFRLSRRRMTAILPNLPHARPVLAALCGRLLA